MSSQRLHVEGLFPGLEKPLRIPAGVERTSNPSAAEGERAGTGLSLRVLDAGAGAGLMEVGARVPRWQASPWFRCYVPLQLCVPGAVPANFSR
jgi:hypothetical protein